MAKCVELVAVDFLESRLIRGLVVGDTHTIGVAAAHVVLRIVDRGAVFAADDLRLLDALAVDLVEDFYLICILIAEDQLEEDFFAGGDYDARAVVDHPAELLRQGEPLKKYIHC